MRINVNPPSAGHFFAGLNDLEKLGVESNTNKAFHWINEKGSSALGSNLLARYEFFLDRLRNRSPISILEMGAGPADNVGASMRCWKSYFRDNTDLHVADLDPAAGCLSSEGFQVHIGDLGDQAFLHQLKSKAWDFVLDDASHIWWHQILAFKELFPSLKKGGVYIIEDLNTSYGDYRESYGGNMRGKDAASYFLAMTRAVNGIVPFLDSDKREVDAIHQLDQADYDIVNQIDLVAWMSNACLVIRR